MCEEEWLLGRTGRGVKDDLSVLSKVRNRRYIAHFLRYVRTKPNQRNKKNLPLSLNPLHSADNRGSRGNSPESKILIQCSQREKVEGGRRQEGF